MAMARTDGGKKKTVKKDNPELPDRRRKTRSTSFKIVDAGVKTAIGVAGGPKKIAARTAVRVAKTVLGNSLNVPKKKKKVW